MLKKKLFTLSLTAKVRETNRTGDEMMKKKKLVAIDHKNKQNTHTDVEGRRKEVTVMAEGKEEGGRGGGRK